MPKLQAAFMLTDKGYRDLKKAIAACTLTNFSLMIPFGVTLQMFIELIRPLTGGQISWQRMWLLLGSGLVGAIVVFLCCKNDYRKTYVVSYMESENARTSLAEHIRRLPMSVFNSKDLTELTTNIIGDVHTTEHILSHLVPQLIANLISIAVICLMLAVYDWRMALAMFITVPLAFFIIYTSRRIYGKLSKKHIDAQMAASGQVQEYLEGVKVIRACNLDGERFAALEGALKTMKRLAIQTEFGTGIFVTGAQVVLQAGVGLTVFLGAVLLTGGQIRLIPLLVFLMVVVRIYGPVVTELTMLPEFFYHRIVLRRIRDLVAIKPMEGSGETPITRYDIELSGVDFRYQENGERVLQDITVTFPENSITALVGPSGSGKSTVARLIARFWDVEKGEITIGGVNVKTLDPEYLMEHMAFVFQEVVLFNDSIYNNIRIGNTGATREQVLEAARLARCDEFVEKLPEGYETLLGENGATLSGGERQRLSIARALLKDAPIILLDEATASLDPENEALIQQAIGTLIRGKTVIVIAHRLRTVVDADQIVVLDQGRLSEKGVHEELMARQGLYHRLFTIQQESLGWSV